MSSSAPSLDRAATLVSEALAAVETLVPPLPKGPDFHVVPFRRSADGAIVPGAAVKVTNGDIAWRWAMAAAHDHDNVGAAAFSGEDLAATGIFTNGMLLTKFGEVNLDALRH